MLRTYEELMSIRSFVERYRYLRMAGVIGESTFGYDRYLNQLLYTSKRWRSVRDKIIIRDEGCDLGDPDYEIADRITIHHMNPISFEDIEYERPWVFDPKFLICTSQDTHRVIHYGDETLLPALPITRRRNDTCPWK